MELMLYWQGESIDLELTEKGALLKSTLDVDELVKWADIVIIASGDRKLADYTSKIASGKLINRADYPDKGNIIVPNSFYVGDVEISIFTGSKSPLISKYLRKKIQDIITDEDIIKIELQDYARKLLKQNVDNQKSRKKMLYELFEDKNLDEFIKCGNVDQAKLYIDEVIL